MPSCWNKPIAQWEGTRLRSSGGDFCVCSQKSLQSVVLAFPSRLLLQNLCQQKSEKPSGCSEAEPVVAEGCR